MAEILTESFCERCGTRFTFESSGPRRSRVAHVRTLTKGVRNFVLSDGTTFSEALADARSEQQLATTAHQLDAFHRTFNFCLVCRQYTCGACWNEAAGECATCAPVAPADGPTAPGVEARIVPALSFDADDFGFASDPPAPAVLVPDAVLLDAGEAGAAERSWIEPRDGELVEQAATGSLPLEADANLPEAEPAAVSAEPVVASAERAGLGSPAEGEPPGPQPEFTAAETPEPIAAQAAGLGAAAPHPLRPEAERVSGPAEGVPAPPEAVAGPSRAVVPEAPEATALPAEAAPMDTAVEPASTDVRAAPRVEREPEPEPASTYHAPEPSIAPWRVSGVEPGQTLEEALAAYEAQLAAQQPLEPPVEAIVAPAAPVASAEPEPQGALRQPEPAVRADDRQPIEAKREPVVIEGEPQPAAAERDRTAEPVVAEGQPEPASVEAPPEAVAAEPEREPVAVEAPPEPVAAEPEPALVGAPPEPVAAEPEREPDAVGAEPARDDVVPQPTWQPPRRPAVPPAPPLPPTPRPASPEPAAPAPWLTVAPDVPPDAAGGRQPQWPAAARWAGTSARPDVPRTLAGRPLLAAAAAEAVWVESSREVLASPPPPQTASSSRAVPSAQPCISCGLPLSANARFCRRCGSRQA